MSDPLLIYGATGYTGRLVVEGALRLGLRPVLGGRNHAKLAALAGPLGLEYRVAPLAFATRLDAALEGIRVVLHAAGPFAETAQSMAEACIRVGAHYLDLTGEADVIEDLARRHAEARARGVMLMPAVGFDVVASDCLAAYVARQFPTAERIRFGIRGLGLISRGSAKTFIGHGGRPIWVRWNGRLVPAPAPIRERTFDYGDGPTNSVNMNWGDVTAAYYTTGVPNVEVYFESTPLLRAILASHRALGGLLSTPAIQFWGRLQTEFMPDGPTEEERARVQTVIVVEAEDGAARRAAARQRGPQAYTFTAMSAPEVARRALLGDVELGFQTPGRVYGPDFPLQFDGVSREDLE